MEAIKNWLEGSRDFAIGKALYFQHGKSKVLRDLFEMGESSFTRAKLEKALSELAEQLRNAPTPKPGETKPREASVPLSERSDAPEQVKALVQERKRLYGHTKALHEKLHLMSVEYANKYTDPERSTVVIELMQAWETIEQIWKRTMAYDRDGVLPPEPVKVQVVIRSGDTLLRAITNKRSELSKTRKGIIKKKTVEELEAELDELERMYEEESGDDEVEKTE